MQVLPATFFREKRDIIGSVEHSHDLMRAAESIEFEMLKVERLTDGYHKLQALIARELLACPHTFEPDLEEIRKIIAEALDVDHRQS
jgi:hypothetical protein